MSFFVLCKIYLFYMKQNLGGIRFKQINQIQDDGYWSPAGHSEQNLMRLSIHCWDWRFATLHKFGQWMFLPARNNRKERH
mmetsp:Transcript_26147/g.61060  ORF Transcript_26147/g.61060 Transcript_26147/m.61060 type:complete len:80 (-) Transcript_26147:105-344(-)